jgi:hypothetical protein
MFDLERNIRRLRRELALRLPLGREAVDELEAHLRDAVDESLAAGLTPEEAFRQAAARLGDLDMVAAEYAKLASPEAWSWLPARVAATALSAVAACLGYVVVARSAAGQGGILVNLHVFAITIGYVAMSIAGVIAAWSLLSRAWCGWSQVETQVLTSTLGAITLVGVTLSFLGVVLGGFWAHEHLGRYWGWDPREIGGAAVVIWGAAAAWLPFCRRNERTAMLAGLLSTAVALSAWFAPLAGTHAPFAALLTAVFLAAGALSLLAWIPPGKLRFWHTT